ncbi:MAG TPA: hypothetical protein VHI72_08495, partial [Hyphomicrobiaceae bacterium]|nr:hypothetical protein [Hyphomicrobiaceae bacterium]
LMSSRRCRASAAADTPSPLLGGSHPGATVKPAASPVGGGPQRGARQAGPVVAATLAQPAE